MASQFDRSAEDLGNIVALEHVNVLIPDQGLATLFYVSGLGLTRDPYMMTSTDNMWVNVGRSQFHLPTGKPQKLRGKIGLVIPDREPLLQRLERMKKPLAGTKYGFKEHNALSRRPARGATSSACTIRWMASSSAWPMSSSTCRPARPRASPSSTPRCSTP